MLVPHDEDAKALRAVAVNHGVWEVVQRIAAAAIARRRAELRLTFDEPCDALEFIKESLGDAQTCLAPVEAKGGRQFFSGQPVNGAAHSRSARRRASTSSNGSNSAGSAAR